MSEKLQVAVLVENHPYDVIHFQKMLDSFTDCDCFVQPIDLFVQDEANREGYDVVLWYNMNWNEPEEGSVLRRYMEESIGTTRQGIVLLHHALLSFQGWPVFTEVCGLSNRGGDAFQFHQQETVDGQIAAPGHPIAEELADFTLVDETYTIGEPDMPGNEVLMTTNNATSLKTLAWTRQYKNSRVFCYASGHDNAAYGNANFRKVVARGLAWAAGRL